MCVDFGHSGMGSKAGSALAWTGSDKVWLRFARGSRCDDPLSKLGCCKMIPIHMADRGGTGYCTPLLSRVPSLRDVGKSGRPWQEFRGDTLVDILSISPLAPKKTHNVPRGVGATMFMCFVWTLSLSMLSSFSWTPAILLAHKACGVVMQRIGVYVRKCAALGGATAVRNTPRASVARPGEPDERCP